MREYQNVERRRLIGLSMIILVVIIIGFILSQTLLANAIARMTTFHAFVNFISTQITEVTSLGLMFLGFFGGLFFIPLPIEALFTAGLIKGNAMLLSFILLFGGYMIAQIINYILGSFCSKWARQLISIKQLSKVKRWVNRYGSVAVFLVNMIPFLPSPLMTFALALTRYNMTRLFTFLMLGFILKFGAIMIVFSLFN